MYLNYGRAYGDRTHAWKIKSLLRYRYAKARYCLSLNAQEA